MRPPRALASALVVVVAGAVAGCGGAIHGVVVTNQTDRIVRAELLQLRKDGEMTVYSTQTLGIGAEFKHKVEAEERRPGMRVRFTLEDQRPTDGNWVMLNLPDSRDRVYDLMLLGTHLSAKEQTKNRKLKNPD